MSNKHLYLVAVDGSEWGNRAADHAIQLAEKTQAQVRLITVIPWAGYQPLALGEMGYPQLGEQEEEDMANQEIFAPILEKHKNSTAEISCESHKGHPVSILQKKAKKEKASYVFVGRRGRSRVADLVLGSVANSLAHTLGIPIVLVP